MLAVNVIQLFHWTLADVPPVRYFIWRQITELLPIIIIKSRSISRCINWLLTIQAIICVILSPSFYQYEHVWEDSSSIQSDSQVTETFFGRRQSMNITHSVSIRNNQLDDLKLVQQISFTRLFRYSLILFCLMKGKDRRLIHNYRTVSCVGKVRPLWSEAKEEEFWTFSVLFFSNRSFLLCNMFS